MILFMNIFQITLIAIMVTESQNFVNSIQGSVSYLQSEECEDIMITRNGSTLICIK